MKSKGPGVCTRAEFEGWFADCFKGHKKVNYDSFFEMITPRNADFTELIKQK